ncbi:MAG: carbohydrate-binding protein, partial [Duncaniella sp.]|nr:carbohydrate-binding protein [Duncaniella sp.]
VIRLARQSGPVVGTIPRGNTGSTDVYKDFSARLKKVKGIHDLYFCFEGDGDSLFNLDWWQMK